MIGFKKYIEGKANKNNTNYVCRSQCKSRKQSVFIERGNCSTIAWWRHPFQNGFFPFSIPRTKNEDYAKRILIQLTFCNVTVVVSFLVLEWQNNIFFFWRNSWRRDRTHQSSFSFKWLLSATIWMVSFFERGTLKCCSKNVPFNWNSKISTLRLNAISRVDDHISYHNSYKMAINEIFRMREIIDNWYFYFALLLSLRNSFARHSCCHMVAVRGNTSSILQVEEIQFKIIERDTWILT